MELSGPSFIKTVTGSIIVNRGFKYKEQINRFYLKMNEFGIIKRANTFFKRVKNPLQNFQDNYRNRYNVIDEGVMFEHIKLIVYGYFLFLIIPMMVLILEILYHKYKTNS